MRNLDSAQWQLIATWTVAFFAFLAVVVGWRATYYLKRQDRRQQGFMELGVDVLLQHRQGVWRTAVWTFENRGPHPVRITAIRVRQPRDVQLAPAEEQADGTLVADQKSLGRFVAPNLVLPPNTPVRYRCLVYAESPAAARPVVLAVEYEERGARVRKLVRRLRRSLSE